ncbi:MAG: hypothetical protein WC264_02120 [Candidatus Paceibacterota bacterium]|jgi:hypothetical protein
MSWLKKFKNWFLSVVFFYKKRFDTLDQSIYISNASITTNTNTGNIDTSVSRPVSSADEVEKNNLVQSFITLEENTKTAVKRIEKTENLVYLGFIVFLVMLATVALSYLDLIRSSLEKDNNEIMLYEKVINQEANMKILKNCLKFGGENKCFEN